ncbi:amidohydrolase family protein [Myxococcota bacterium]|nr:amidohydrolase family protein [Myxococcota bacterium]
MHDLVLRRGLVVDGSGEAPSTGDVAVDGGRIVSVGHVEDRGRQEIDASGCWITPGFIDPHTHLDAQLCWDPSGSPCTAHGVTSVVLGLCGFGVAPCPPGGDDYLLRALEVVEEIPFAATRIGVPFTWETWRDYRDHLSTQDLGVNVAGFVPHSSLRYAVMGERAREATANEQELEAMVAALKDALEAGAIGFATSRGPNHVDGFGGPVPSRQADDDELEALVGACRGRLWQINIETKFSGDAAALRNEVGRYAGWTRRAGARLTWTPFYADRTAEIWPEVLAENAQWNAEGLRIAPQVTPVPITLLLRFDEQSAFTAIPGWQPALKGYFSESTQNRQRRLADPEVRRSMKGAKPEPRNPLNPDFERWTFAVAPSNPALSGRTLAQLARETGRHAVDALCDQILADDFRTRINVPILNRDEPGVLDLITDPHTVVGLGDAGAHVMSVTNYRYPTFLLGEWVHRQGRLPIEKAIRLLTSAPAELHGLVDRGRIRPGNAADLCVIEPGLLALDPVEVVHDLPGGSPRLFQGGRGFRAVFVNGERTVADDEPTGRRPGRVLSAHSP